jgi:hypothetical protein
MTISKLKSKALQGVRQAIPDFSDTSKQQKEPNPTPSMFSEIDLVPEAFAGMSSSSFRPVAPLAAPAKKILLGGAHRQRIHGSMELPRPLEFGALHWSTMIESRVPQEGYSGEPHCCWVDATFTKKNAMENQYTGCDGRDFRRSHHQREDHMEEEEVAAKYPGQSISFILFDLI